uniref:Uncharacterized protein n=1 Tax=Fagus sylvatica TaxID=28930 RepID=A0A2N9FDM1_FAGSY
MAGVEHVISMEQTLSRKVERTEAGETSGGHDQPVIATEASEKLSIAVHEKVCTSPLGQRFKKLRDAGANQAETRPKIQKVVFLLQEQTNFQKYYEPRVVSLGPIHHGKSKYQRAENYKLRLAQAFVSDSGKSDEYIYGQIEKNIEQLKEYFDEEVIEKYDNETLAWMLFVDGCAILQFIYFTVKNMFSELKVKNDQLAFAQQDLFLLENQLPYQLLKDLMKLSAKKKELKLGIRTFIDMHSIGNSVDKTPSRKGPASKASKKDWQSFRNVLELKAAGIKLEPSKSSGLRDIRFTRKCNFYPGTLWLPPITVDDSTGPKFLNLIAFEMCPDFENNYGVTSYISFLDSLIDEANDVIELRKARILGNLLGSDQEVAQLFNEIGRDLVPNPEIYSHVRTQIQEYYDNKLMTWLSQFFHNHFSSPWTFLAFLGALLALALSAVQTWYTIDSPPGPCDDFCKHYPH